MIDFKGSQFEREIILWGVRWYVAYPISYRQLEEMMGERGVAVDHSTLNRWVIKYAPEFDKQFRRRQRSVGRSWRLDETYVKIKGKWAYLYRAVSKEDDTIDFLLTPTRDRDAAEAFLRKAIRNQRLPEKRLCRKVDDNILLSTISSVFGAPAFQYIVSFVNFATEPAFSHPTDDIITGVPLLFPNRL